MQRTHVFKMCWQPRRLQCLAFVLVAAMVLARGPAIAAQDTPLISGGVGFVTSTNGGNTTYIPVVSPLLAAPIGNHILVESRATILDSIFPKGNGQGYTDNWFLGLSYLQMDYIA